jgi:hypothetical protein
MGGAFFDGDQRATDHESGRTLGIGLPEDGHPTEHANVIELDLGERLHRDRNHEP